MRTHFSAVSSSLSDYLNEKRTLHFSCTHLIYYFYKSIIVHNTTWNIKNTLKSGYFILYVLNLPASKNLTIEEKRHST